MVQHVLLRRQSEIQVPLPPLTWEAQHSAGGHKTSWGQDEGNRSERDAGAWRAGHGNLQLPLTFTGLLLHFTLGNTQTKSEIKRAVKTVFQDSDLPKLVGCKVKSPQESPLAPFLLKFSLKNLPLLPLSSLTK